MKSEGENQIERLSYLERETCHFPLLFSHRYGHETAKLTMTLDDEIYLGGKLEKIEKKCSKQKEKIRKREEEGEIAVHYDLIDDLSP